MKDSTYFWDAFWVNFTFVVVGLYYGSIPGFVVLLLTDTIPLAIIVTLVCGYGTAAFITRSCDRDRERRAERSNRN